MKIQKFKEIETWQLTHEFTLKLYQLRKQSEFFKVSNRET